MSHHHHGNHHSGDRCGCDCTPHPHFHHQHHGCCDEGAYRQHQVGGCCGESGHRPHHAKGCCGGDSFSLKRRYLSPEEKKEKLVLYIDALKKELAGAEATLESL